MTFFQTPELSKTLRKEILTLWNREYPVELNYKNEIELDKYIEGLIEASHLLVFDESSNMVGWYFDFIRDKERWFAIILDGKAQGKGCGTQVLNYAKQNNSELNGWVIDVDGYKKVNGELYKSPLQFYLKNGFEIQGNKRLEDEKISAIKIRWVKDH